jgi:FkbM family methyltransferase
LCKTISGNSINNVHPYFYAIHDQDDQEVCIYSRDPANIGGNSIHGEGGLLINTVKTIKIDTFVRNNGISRIDVMKIDIEGNELNALKGGRDSIMKFRPIILCEISPEHDLAAGNSSIELYDYLINELQYEAKRLNRGALMELSRFAAVSREQNIFFFPAET